MRNMFIKGKIDLVLLVLLTGMLCVGVAVNAQEKTPMGALADELGLTMEQTMLLKDVLMDFSGMKKAISQSGDSDEIKLEETKKLQRKLFEELSKFLTPGQIEGYQRYIRGARKEGLTALKNEDGASGTGGTPNQLSGANFPWFTALRQGLKKLDISGLQKQAVEELFKDLEERAVKMSYWEPNYDPSEDSSISGIFNSKIQWILNLEQYKKYMDILSGVDPVEDEKKFKDEPDAASEETIKEEKVPEEKPAGGNSYFIEELEDSGVLIDEYDEDVINEDN